MSSQSQSVDSFDSLLDLSQYDEVDVFGSPSLSPTTSSKSQLARPASAVSTPTISTTSPPTNSGPSHKYELYKQQTPFVPGAIASTLAVNQANMVGFSNLDYLAGLNAAEHDLFDFDASPTGMNPSDIEMDFGSPTDSMLFDTTTTINPIAIEQPAPLPSVATPSNLGRQRLWPGAHSQAAMAKARQQQQQQQMMMQEQQRQQQVAKPRTKNGQPTDPIVEQKITQLLNSMRAKPASDDSNQVPVLQQPRLRKDEEDMDEDERLLASEEGKKLSSKERRQLRNKVSARAFRSRRKEYITQLEAEINGKVQENGELLKQNRALLEENRRLSDLTRMLLSSPSFSNFLDNLSSQPQLIPQPVQQAPMKQEPAQRQRQMPKDVNPFGGPQQQNQMNMAMIPEVDFSNFNPQVFTVHTPEIPIEIDASMLSGKSSNFVDSLESEQKVEMPIIERPAVQEAKEAPKRPTSASFEADPEFALYHEEASVNSEEAPKELNTDSLANIDIFGGIESEKALARYDLVDATESEAAASLAIDRVQRISASIDAMMERIHGLTL